LDGSKSQAVPVLPSLRLRLSNGDLIERLRREQANQHTTLSYSERFIDRLLAETVGHHPPQFSFNAVKGILARMRIPYRRS
jgi:hypothetical protein